MSQFQVFGIRHHGPGSARSLKLALEELRPDAILVEGPPEGDDVLPLAAHAGIRPPVALLIYRPDSPQQGVFAPFAVFSPEWQALQYGLKQGVPVRFIDLPQAHQMALAPAAAPEPPAPEQLDQPRAETTQAPAPNDLRLDPFAWLALAAGQDDGERWWEQMVEERHNSTDVFLAILEAMRAVRDAVGPAPAPEREALREAHMRQSIRAAQREGLQRIAVVCGAWHAPALAELPPARQDAALLKDLPKVKVVATWIPWTNSRLTYASGYGAGIQSPGWYQHLWQHSHQVAIRWLIKVARLLRRQDLDASSASVIEAVRLAETLAALRGRSLPGLPELTEASQAVLCFGAEMPMQLIAEQLIVGEGLGHVPDETPQVPLQQDLRREQKRLRLPPEPTARDLDLDLRQPTGLDRSRLLHRLQLLGVRWGLPLAVVRGAANFRPNSTFHERWRVQWQPEFAINVVDASRFGNTLPEAATAWVIETAGKETALPALTLLLQRVLPAELPGALAALMQRLQALAAIASDIGLLMEALPPLAQVQRYGNVRQTDTAAIGLLVQGLVTRICIGLPGACASLNDQAALEMNKRLAAVHAGVTLLQQPDQQAAWHKALSQLADQAGLHGLLAGRCCRLLHEQGVFVPADVVLRLRRALSAASEPAQAGAWVEGLLSGSAALLLHDAALWGVLDAWLTELPGDAFIRVLPLLRRTFGTFQPAERRQMGERVRRGATLPGDGPGDQYDTTRAEAVLPLLNQLLGLEEAHT